MGQILNSSEEEIREKFSKLINRVDLANLLEISDYKLRYHLYIYPLNKAYKSFKIPKKTGGERIIYAPITSLKIIQRKLNYILKCIYQPKLSTQGYVSGKSIITNSKQHLRQRFILNLDIKDFFPSINFGRVRGLFMAPPYGCSKEVSTVLAQICCHENQLPQGVPTSPTISNMICARMDTHLQRLAGKYTALSATIWDNSCRDRMRMCHDKLLHRP